jgi:hypothetical protein
VLEIPRNSPLCVREFEDLLRDVLPLFQNPHLCSEVGAPKHLFPFRHIKDELLFARKTSSRFLQIANTCAFFIKRKLAGKTNTEYFLSD